MKFILQKFQITILLFFAICGVTLAQEIQVTEWKTLEGHKSFVLSIAFSPDGNILASGSGDGTIKIWSTVSGKEIVMLKGHQNWVRSVSFSPDGNILVSGSEDKTIKLWSTTAGTEIKTIKSHNDFVGSVSYSPDSKILASGSADGTIKLWSIASGKEIITLKGHSGAINSVVFSPNGTFLASGSSDGTIKLWSVETGKEIITFKGHSAIVNSVVFNPDGTILASGSSDGTIRLWSVETGRELETFRGHSAIVNSVVFSPDGTILASGSSDGTIRLWSSETGRELKMFRENSAIVYSISFSPDGTFLASGGSDSKVKIFKIDYPRWELLFGGIDEEIIVIKDKEGVKRAIYFYALKLKDSFIPPSMPEKERNIDDLRKPKGEFETEALYRQRLKEADSEELRIKAEYERLVEIARLAFDKRQAEIRSKVERLLPITREEISVTFDIGKYNAEDETFPIFVEEIGGTVSLLVPISDAPDFKSRAGEHKAIVTTQMNMEGEKDYWNLYVTDLRVNRIYNAVTEADGALVLLEERLVNFDAGYEDLNPPRIIIEEPSYSRGMKKVVREQTLTVRGKAIDENGIYEVLVNDSEAQLSADGSFWAEIKLRVGENKIVVIAEDTKGNRATKSFTVVRESVGKFPPITAENEEFNFGKYHALVIAVQDYTYKSVTDLDYPIQDAKLVMNTLIDNYTFEKRNVHFLENPDRGEILKKFTELRSKLTDNDNLLIFYAGHGYWDEDERQGYWLPRNADWNDRSDWLSNSVLRDKIRAVKAKHTLLISDACFSGGIFKVREAFVNPEMSIQKIYEMPSRKAITSGALMTVPDKSVFVEYLVKRLKNNREKYLYSEKLYVNMKDAVINNSPTNQTPQFGVIGSTGDEGGDFIFVRK